MAMPTLVFCAHGNRRYAVRAIAAGFRYGSRLPAKVYFPVWFADQNWRQPDRVPYMRALREHKPAMATVLDWESEEQLPEVLDWAEEAAQWAERVLIIPKVQSGVTRLPRRVGRADVVLAYSVPSKYGATELLAWEFAGWPIHLLGGSPMRQLETWRYLAAIAEVVSADGNAIQRAANYGVFYDGRANGWATRDSRVPKGPDLCYRAFERSCQEVMAAWRRLTEG